MSTQERIEELDYQACKLSRRMDELWMRQNDWRGDLRTSAEKAEHKRLAARLEVIDEELSRLGQC